MDNRGTWVRVEVQVCELWNDLSRDIDIDMRCMTVTTTALVLVVFALCWGWTKQQYLDEAKKKKTVKIFYMKT
ncbi:unnamed protein product [Acanthoscelides obtectus]|uniref:Uncharacterized protein n=1 Tax=Acanthoscelides obtectus TaxID=200917 RepID=A0A9P0LF33_ACAOB|nr:unnamed protein product [Acanthoscelides obtectus]CAK1632873.1 hypothetical protein AOBTE_LOCUS7782 [Acanthoscelides obtectus]